MVPVAAGPGPRSGSCVSACIRRTVIVGGACALAASLLVFEVRFENSGHSAAYLLLCGLPVLWCVAVAIAGGYDSHIIGLGSDEFRWVLNAAVGFTAVLAVFSYAADLDIAHGCVAIALPTTAVLDPSARFLLRKRLHRLCRTGRAPSAWSRNWSLARDLQILWKTGSAVFHGHGAY